MCPALHQWRTLTLVLLFLVVQLAKVLDCLVELLKRQSVVAILVKQLEYLRHKRVTSHLNHALELWDTNAACALRQAVEPAHRGVRGNQADTGQRDSHTKQASLCPQVAQERGDAKLQSSI